MTSRRLSIDQRWALFIRLPKGSLLEKPTLLFTIV